MMVMIHIKSMKNQYVRFNNSAFVSNYKRNDLLTTTMSLYCIPVGKFDKKRFDFIREIGKMERLISTAEQSKRLADIYPPSKPFYETEMPESSQESENDKVDLYDVLYACVTAEVKNG
ncbi:MAG: DUF6414 family protein [Clostridiales bacterium]|nr:DUF6414 family protein [Clostridiales bacterium]